jgi:ribosomal protein L13E
VIIPKMKRYTQTGRFFPANNKYRYAETKQNEAHKIGTTGDLRRRTLRTSQAMDNEKNGIAPT